LWKKLTDTDAQALLNIQPPAGTGGGAKHIPLWKSLDIKKFLGARQPTGGTSAQPEFRFPVYGPAGEVQDMIVMYNKRGESREEWLIPRQNAEERQPAWRPGRKLPSDRSQIPGKYILLIRLADDSIHARVAPSDEVARMPLSIRSRLIADEQGVMEL
jgi:hypothetical protein